MPPHRGPYAGLAAAALGLLLLAAPSSARAGESEPPAFQESVDALAAEYGRRYNASFAVAVVDADSGSVYEAAHGALRPWSVDALGAAPMTPESLFPVGSATKPFTAVAILQLVEAGKLSLDTKVHEVVDDWLGEPLAALIPANNSMIEQVTVEQLLAHTSGLPDYEDENIRAWTLASPKRNFTPLDYIRYGMANGGNFHFAPGSGDIAIYSGIGYILAGFVLAAVQDAPTWADLDQSFIFDRLPAAEAAAMRAQTNFVMTGVCDALFGDRLVGQYIVQDFFDAGDGWKDEPLEPAWLHGGLSYASCGNGYTMGNMVAAAAGPATFWAGLMSGKLVSPASLELMLDPPAGGARPLFFDGDPPTPVANVSYGLGVMTLPNNTVGHPGMDWGSGSLVLFDRGSNFSVAINTVTSEPMGTNTSLSYADNQPFGFELLGALFGAAREFKAASN